MVLVNNEGLKFNGMFYAFLSVALTAIWYPAIKYGLNNISPIQAAGIETLVSFLIAFMTIKLTKKSFITDKVKPLLFIGLINAFATIFLYVSLSLLDPVMAALLGRNYVLFSVLMSLIILKERISKMQCFLLVISIFGGYAFVYDGITRTGILGMFAVIAYTLLFAIGNAYTKKLCVGVDSTIILFYIKASSILPILILGATTEKQDFFNTTAYDFMYIAIVSIISSYIGVKFFYKSLAIVNFSYVNVVRSTGPIFVLVYSLPFFYINLSIINLIGGIIVITSVALLSILEGKRLEKFKDAQSANFKKAAN